jgi:hypothetical protein
MGYTTEFTGHFNITPPLSEPHRYYLSMFAATRRQERDPTITETRSDPIRFAVGLPPGAEGEYFVGETGSFGQDCGDDVVGHNTPPATQPSLWCQWTPTDDGKRLVWDGGEKFYHYIEWLEYLISHFFKPWDYELSGEVQWQGAEDDDTGTIRAFANNVIVS